MHSPPTGRHARPFVVRLYFVSSSHRCDLCVHLSEDVDVRLKKWLNHPFLQSANKLLQTPDNPTKEAAGVSVCVCVCVCARVCVRVRMRARERERGRERERQRERERECAFLR